MDIIIFSFPSLSFPPFLPPFSFSFPREAVPFALSLAERLRRWTANPLCSARVGSNPILVGQCLWMWAAIIPNDWCSYMFGHINGQLFCYSIQTKCRKYVRLWWYSGEHSCLPSSWPGFDSRPTHFTGLGLKSMRSSFCDIWWNFWMSRSTAEKN